MPNALRLWLRRYTPALACVYLFFLLTLCLGSLAVLFEWHGSGRVFSRVDRFCSRRLDEQRAGWATRFDQADKLGQAGELAAAEKELDALLADLPHLSRVGPDGLMRARVFKKLAEIYLAEKEPAKALRACDTLLQMNPGYAEETFLRGKALLATGKTQEGEGEIRKSLEIDPNYTSAVEFLIARYGAEGRNRDVLDVYDRYRSAFSASLGMMDARDGKIELLREGNRKAARGFMPALEESFREHRMALGVRPEVSADAQVDEIRLNLRVPPEWGSVEIEWLALYGPRPLSEETAPALLKVEGRSLEPLRGLIRVSPVSNPQSAVPNPKKRMLAKLPAFPEIFPVRDQKTPHPALSPRRGNSFSLVSFVMFYHLLDIPSITGGAYSLPSPGGEGRARGLFLDIMNDPKFGNPQSAVRIPQLEDPQSSGGFQVTEGSVSASVRLPQPVPMGKIDAIGVRMRSAKKLSRDARAMVERARAQEAPSGAKETLGQ